MPVFQYFSAASISVFNGQCQDKITSHNFWRFIFKICTSMFGYVKPRNLHKIILDIYHPNSWLARIIILFKFLKLKHFWQNYSFLVFRLVPSSKFLEMFTKWTGFLGSSARCKVILNATITLNQHNLKGDCEEY